MSITELVETLKQNQADQVQDIWTAAENEAGEIRKQTSETIARLRQEHEIVVAKARKQESEQFLSDACDRAQQCQLFAERKLADMVFQEAGQMLATLRTNQYEEVFAKLAAEIPERQWQSVRVNPQDDALAGKHFPNTRIETDSTICGGFIVTAESRKITVDNTFEKRFERNWAMVMPLIIKEICCEFTKDEAADKY